MKNSVFFRYLLILAGSTSVSYTHRDVYKRQPLWYAKHIGIKAVFFYLLLFFYSYFTIIPVSYTHLDVYKRQLYTPLATAKALHFLSFFYLQSIVTVFFLQLQKSMVHLYRFA